MTDSNSLPDGLISYGPDTNCTLALCPVEWSVLAYQPSRVANGVFIGLFSISMIIHIIQGIHYRSWSFMNCMAVGCIDEIIGYAGRLVLHENPFSFAGFLIQILCIATGPIFYCAAIYVTLSRTIAHLDPTLSRFNPKLFYWIFIPCDIIALILQLGGGVASSESIGTSTAGVDVTLAGLAFQVFSIMVFILASADYFIRYVRRKDRNMFATNFKIYICFLFSALILILARCIYRVYELSEGYTGSLMHNQPLFIWLEGVLIIISVFCLNLGHPGLGFQKSTHKKALRETDTAADFTEAEDDRYVPLHNLSSTHNAASP